MKKKYDTALLRRAKELDLTLSDIARYIGVCRASADNYLIGAFRPNEERCKLLSEVLQIDYDTCNNIIEDTYAEFHKDGGRPSEITKKNKRRNSAKKVIDKIITEEPKKVVEAKPVETKPNDKIDIFEILYGGDTSYDEFMEYYQLVAAKNPEALRYLYNRVDFDTYNKAYIEIMKWCN